MSAGLVRLWQRRLSSAPSSSARILSSVLLRSLHSAAPASSLIEQHEPIKPKGKWLTLPPFSPPIDCVSVGKELAGRRPVAETEPMSALKWVRRCCPHLPMSLVHKLFRLRQVRRDQTAQVVYNGNATPAEQGRLRRVSVKDAMMPGEVIFLPVSVQNLTTEGSYRSKYNDVEISFVRSLELYKDEAIIVVNKPPGMPVQGGVGIRYSMDALAANCLKYECSEPPRLVHRLDRDSSGVLVLGRTQTSTTILHSLFREKTSGALADIVLEDGKSERIIIADDGKSASSQHALTEYKVIRSSHDYTWLELFPLTGRKHQLRVHCAEVLGTPIVGDHKYGRHAHRKWEPMRLPESIIKGEKIPKEKLPFGLELDGGSISEKLPGLHLHCKQMVLPNISVALQQLQSSTGHDFSKVEKLNLVAPLPSHMQRSWEILSSLL
ncbi:RNA pseudouridine synthase 4, mitochondrial-like isoform X2 [Musa acuminata AAA Group]|uniref:RNA pseudouridine synthase 4, mitochondrial-like isoform X2 n=1 Tax=Musa acuminata AAA Group TaxID=214697 RepID=UPI0031D07457